MLRFRIEFFLQSFCWLAGVVTLSYINSRHSNAVIKLDNNIKDLGRAPIVDTAGDFTELNQLIPTYPIPWKRKEERYDLIQKLEPGLEEVELLVTLEKTKSLTKGRSPTIPCMEQGTCRESVRGTLWSRVRVESKCVRSTLYGAGCLGSM